MTEQMRNGYFSGMILCWACFEGTSSTAGTTTADCGNCLGLTCQCPHSQRLPLCHRLTRKASR